MYSEEIEHSRNVPTITNNNNNNSHQTKTKKNRHFYNMKKLFKLEHSISNKKNNELFKLYNIVKYTPDTIHNLTNISIPFNIKLLLSLGLNFCLPCKPNISKLSNELLSSVRKLSWRVHFLNSERSNTCYTKFHKIVSDSKKNNYVNNSIANCQPILFNTDRLLKNFSNRLSINSHKHDFVNIKILNSLTDFVHVNNIVICNADKNAGIVICDSSKYEAEVNRQLEDLSSYFPSSQYQYDERIDKLKYEVSRFVKIFPEELQISKIMPTNFSPASFYILPKIHKDFQDFPKE